jgi:hypothetical protein
MCIQGRGTAPALLANDGVTLGEGTSTRPPRGRQAVEGLVSVQLRTAALPGRPIESTNLADILGRMLDKGSVIGADMADVDLVYVGMRALVTSVARAEAHLLPQMSSVLGKDALGSAAFGRDAFRSAALGKDAR